jgi:hypothetical protein
MRAAARGRQRRETDDHTACEFPLRHNLFTLLSVVLAEGRATVSEMRKPIPFRAPHRHQKVTSYELRQREGIPYEVERVHCTQCSRLLGERPLRRAAA